MNRFQCYVSAMTVASVSSMSIGNMGSSMGGPMPTMSSSFQTASLSSSSHPQHYNPGYHPLAIRSSSSATVLRSSRGGRRDRDCLIAHLSTEPLSSIIDPANDDTITNDDDDDVDNDDHHEKNAFATSYHAPVMHEECIDALLQRSHNQTKKKQKYKSKAVAAAALLRQYEQREDDSFSPMVDIDIDGGDSSTVVCDTIGGGGGGGGGGGSTRPRVFIDGTLGGGGHSHHLLRQLAANDVVIGVDVDPSALATASDRLRQYIVSTDDTVDNAKEEHDKPIFLPIQSNFKDMVEVLKDVTHPITGELLLRQRQQRRADDDDDDDDDGDETAPFSGVDGILLDLGVSSHQIDTMERGFAFMKDGPLDMRMGNGSWKNQVTDTTTQTSTTNDTNQQPSPPPTNSCLSTLTAADICNEFTENDLIQTFQTHANETRSRARRIAQSIISHRPLRTTADLKAAIAAVTPAFHKKSRRMGQMATCGRIFSALRIVVNREDDVLTEALEGMAPGVVGKGGRLVVLSYHSLEDRAVKRVMRDGMVEGRSGVGVNLERDVYGNEIVDGDVRPWRTLGKRMKATDVEIERNRRARSATLRVAERL